MQSTSWETLDWKKHKLESRLLGEIPNLRYADDITLMAESEEELKSLLMNVKEESEKVGLKLNIQITKILASGPITSWEKDGETMETVSDFILGGSKITADCDCSHEIKRHLLLGRKVMTNLDSIFKSRDITLPKKGPSSQGYGFSCGHVWMWELDCEESWARKNWCFWTVVLKALESPLDCKEIQPVHPKGDRSWVFIGRTDAEAEIPILWPPVAKSWLIWKDPDIGKDGGQDGGKDGEGDDRGWDVWMASPTQWTWNWVDSGSFWWTGRPGMLQFMGLKSKTWLSNWTDWFQS